MARLLGRLAYPTMIRRPNRPAFGLSEGAPKKAVPDSQAMGSESGGADEADEARLIASIRELLLMAPEGDMQAQLSTRVESIARAHNYTEAVIRSSKIGRELAVDITFLAPPDSGKVAIDTLDNIRAEVEQSLSELGYKLWMNIVFTKDRRWA